MLLALSGPGSRCSVKIGVPAGDVANGAFVVIVLACFGWPPIARIIRGQVLSIREREFVDAARLMGAPRRRMYFKEVLPEPLGARCWSTSRSRCRPTSRRRPRSSYLGVGVKPPTPTLGNILTDSIDYSTADFFFFFTPALLIAIIVVSFNLLGDGLRDALDPRGSR